MFLAPLNMSEIGKTQDGHWCYGGWFEPALARNPEDSHVFLTQILNPFVSIVLTIIMSLCVRKPTVWVPTWSDSNRAVQSQKMVRGWKFWI